MIIDVRLFFVKRQWQTVNPRTAILRSVTGMQAQGNAFRPW